MIGLASIIGAGASLASGVIGGIQSARRNKQAQAEIDKENKRQEDEYKRRYSQDYTQTAEAQAALTRTRDMALEQVKAVRANAAVMGGGNAQVAAAQQAAADAIAETNANIAIAGDQRKEVIADTMQAQSQQASNQRAAALQQQAANSAAAGSQGMQAGMGLVQADANAIAETGQGLFHNMFKVDKKK